MPKRERDELTEEAVGEWQARSKAEGSNAHCRKPEEEAEQGATPPAPAPLPSPLPAADPEPLELPKLERTYNGEPQTTWAFDSTAPKPAATSAILVPKDVVEAKGGSEAVKKIIADAVAKVAPGLTVQVGLTHVPGEEDNLSPLETLVHKIDAHTEWVCKLERDGACSKKIEQEVCNLLLLLCEGSKYEEEAGTHPVNLAAVADVRPLHTAAGSAAPRVLQALLAFPKTDLGVENCFKQTPLKRLVGYGSKQKAAPECVDIYVDAMLERKSLAAELDKKMDVPLEKLAKARAEGANLYTLLTEAHRAKISTNEAAPAAEEAAADEPVIDPEEQKEPPKFMDALAKKTHPMTVDKELAQPLASDAAIATCPNEDAVSV